MNKIKVVQIWCGESNNDIYKKYEYYMDKMRDMFPNYERIIRPESTGVHPIVASDTLRIELASQMPDMFYFDCDVEFNEVPKFDLENGLPYFGLARGRINHSIFYVNNDIKFFKNILEEKERRKLQYVFGWPMKVIRNSKVNIIDTSIYTHYQFTTSLLESTDGNIANNARTSLGFNTKQIEWD